jgi:hypothetical protein
MKRAARTAADAADAAIAAATALLETHRNDTTRIKMQRK